MWRRWVGYNATMAEIIRSGNVVSALSGSWGPLSPTARTESSVPRASNSLRWYRPARPKAGYAMANTSFDTAGFYQAIDQVRVARGVSWYAVFKRTGETCCISRAKRAHVPMPDTRAVLARWAGIDASAFERKAGQAS